MSSAVPAIPLFGDAYLADTRHLSLEEHGAYLQLIMIAWRIDGCRLPDDDERLARMLGVTPKKWAKLKPVVMAFWTRTKNGWEQKRLTKERRFVTKKQEQNREAANARWNAKPLEDNTPGDADAPFPQCERNAPPPPPPKKEESKGEATPLSAPLPVDDAVAVWSEAASRKGWKPVRPTLNDNRRKQLGARLRQAGLDGWRDAIARAEASEMLGGHDPPGWFTFAFVIKADNFLKLIEGNYDRNFTNHSGQRGTPSGWEAAYASNIGSGPT